MRTRCSRRGGCADTSVDLPHVGEQTARDARLDRLADVKAERDDGTGEAAMEALREATRDGENAMP